MTQDQTAPAPATAAAARQIELVAHSATKTDFGHGIVGLSCSAGDWDNALDTSMTFTSHLLDLTDETKHHGSADDDPVVDDPVVDDDAEIPFGETDGILACDMRRREPFDFAQCHVHDTTFPLGEVCKFQGKTMWEVYSQEADTQRERAVRAELALERVSPMDDTERESFKTAYAMQAVQIARLRASVAQVEALLARSSCGWVEVAEVTAALAPPVPLEPAVPLAPAADAAPAGLAPAAPVTLVAQDTDEAAQP